MFGMQLDLVYGALSHTIRRDVIDRLSASPARVTELAAEYPVSLAAVSKHIVVLETAGLIKRDVRGRDHVLTLQPQPLRTAASWLGDYRQFWENRLDQLDREIRKTRR